MGPVDCLFERTPMRLVMLCVCGVVASGLAAATDFTYLEGSVAELARNVEGTVSYSVGKTIQLKTPQHTIKIPYVDITAAELGDIHAPAPDPVYKVWSLKKRFAKTETQELTVTFKDTTGQEQTVTLELARQDASAILATIQDRNDWWGDRAWKTKRNTNQWSEK